MKRSQPAASRRPAWSPPCPLGRHASCPPSAVEAPIDIEDGLPTDAPLVYYTGTPSPSGARLHRPGHAMTDPCPRACLRHTRWLPAVSLLPWRSAATHSAPPTCLCCRQPGALSSPGGAAGCSAGPAGAERCPGALLCAAGSMQMQPGCSSMVAGAPPPLLPGALPGTDLPSACLHPACRCGRAGWL